MIDVTLPSSVISDATRRSLTSASKSVHHPPVMENETAEQPDAAPIIIEAPSIQSVEASTAQAQTSTPQSDAPMITVEAPSIVSPISPEAIVKQDDDDIYEYCYEDIDDIQIPYPSEIPSVVNRKNTKSYGQWSMLMKNSTENIKSIAPSGTHSSYASGSTSATHNDTATNKIDLTKDDPDEIHTSKGSLTINSPESASTFYSIDNTPTIQYLDQYQPQHQDQLQTNTLIKSENQTPYEAPKKIITDDQQKPKQSQQLQQLQPQQLKSTLQKPKDEVASYHVTDSERKPVTNTILANFGAPNVSQPYYTMFLRNISDATQPTLTDTRTKHPTVQSGATETTNAATKGPTKKARGPIDSLNSSNDKLKDSSDDGRATRVSRKSMNEETNIPNKSTKSSNGDTKTLKESLKDSNGNSKASANRGRVPSFLMSGKDSLTSKGPHAESSRIPVAAHKEGDKIADLKRLRTESENESSDDPALKRQKKGTAEEKLIASVSHTLDAMKKSVFDELAIIKATIAERTIKAEDKTAAKEESKPEGKRSSTCSLLPPRPAAPITQDVRDLMKRIRDMNAPIEASLADYEKEYGDTERRELLAQKAEQEKKLKSTKNKYNKAKDKLDAARAELKELENNKPAPTPNNYQTKRIELSKIEDKLKGKWSEFLGLREEVFFFFKEAKLLKRRLDAINGSGSINPQQRDHLANTGVQQVPPQNGATFQGTMMQQLPLPLPPPPSQLQHMNQLQTPQQQQQYMMTHPQQPPPPPQMLAHPSQMPPHVQFNQPENYNYDPYHAQRAQMIQGVQFIPYVQQQLQPKLYEYSYKPNDQPKHHRN